MKRTVGMLLLLGLGVVYLAACDGKNDDKTYGDPEPYDTGGAEDTGTDGWWEDPDDDGDDDKPDDDDDDLENGFDLVVDVDAGTGTFTGDFDAGSGRCEVIGTLVDAAAVSGCGDCSMAMSMTLTSVSVTGDGCGDGSDWDGETMFFGHGLVEIFDWEDVSYHNLYENDEGGGWVEVDGGYSSIDGSIWSISIKW